MESYNRALAESITLGCLHAQNVHQVSLAAVEARDLVCDFCVVSLKKAVAKIVQLCFPIKGYLCT